MSEVQDKILIETSLERAYETAENYPLFVEAFRRKEILYRDEKRARVKITNRLFGLPLSWEGKARKRRNQKIRWIQTRGLLRGLRADWLFIPYGEKATEVSIRGRFRGSGLWGRVLDLLAPLLISRTTKRILQALKDATERGTWSSSTK